MWRTTCCCRFERTMSRNLLTTSASCIVVASALMLIPLYLVWTVFFERDNFRVVTSDLYRSGQMRTGEWNKSFEEHHYRSVLNLRGENKKVDWYDKELEFASEHNIEHYDFALTAKTAPSDAEMVSIVKIMRLAPKPLLVHCNSGADRAGLVSALYVYSIEGMQAASAHQQLSFWYGHFSWLRKTAAMDRALSNFVADHPYESLTTLTDLHVGRRWPT